MGFFYAHILMQEVSHAQLTSIQYREISEQNKVISMELPQSKALHWPESRYSHLHS